MTILLGGSMLLLGYVQRGKRADVAARRPSVELLEVDAHDLVQPIASISAQADLLSRRIQLERASRDDVLDGLEAIRARARELADRLGVLLTARRAGAPGLKREPTDLAGVIEDVRQELPARERLRVRVKADGDLAGLWDSERLRQVLRNLLENALKYSPPESVVTIVAHEGADAVEIACRDSGMGIAHDEMERLFRRFYRSPRAELSTNGTGLGLYGCRVIIEAHGGRIWAESGGPGKGATVRVTLPRSGLPLSR